MQPEKDAWMEKLYREYYGKLVLYVSSAVGDRDRAQDVVQDTFHEAVLHIDHLMAHENPGGWLMLTAKYKAWESERKRQRDLRRFLSWDTDISDGSFPDREGETAVCETEDVPAMEKIKQALTAEEYQLLTRFVLEKANHLELAREFGISVYASQKRLQRIREKLYRFFPERKRKNL